MAATSTSLKSRSGSRVNAVTGALVIVIAALTHVAAHAQQPVPGRASLPGAGPSAGPARLVDAIDVEDHQTQVDINVQFSCAVHYAGHSPASAGDEVRVRLRLDASCGTTSQLSGSESPAVSGASGIVSAARVEPSLGSEITLTLRWTHVESFVLAQGADSGALRVRLLRQRTDQPHILVQEHTDSDTQYAVNLESRQVPYDPAARQAAAQRLQVPVFVSEIVIDQEKWFRLRAGPFDRRVDAEEVLRMAAAFYPGAWLAVADDDVTTEGDHAAKEHSLPPIQPAGADPPLSSQELASILSQARKAMSSHDYPMAVQLLTRLQRQPEYPQRSQAQELLGLTRERAGQVAHAKAEYEEYLRRYPNGAAAERVRNRLRMLRAAAAPDQSSAPNEESAHRWRASGGLSQAFRRDSFGSDLNGPLYATLVENAVFTDADLFVHRDGVRFDSGLRTNFGYVRNLLPPDTMDASSRGYVSAAYLELNDKLLGIRGRVGRQTALADGVFGTFDGARLTYEFAPSWSVRASAGMPVDSSRSPVQTQRRFESIAMGFSPALSTWDSSIYFTRQTDEGNRDRQAVGAQVQYSTPQRSLVGYVDYDTMFQALNAVALLGTVQLPARWQLVLDLEHRNAPLLTLRNALYGQSAGTLTELARSYSTSQLMGLARDRTAELSTCSVSLLRPLGERFQVSFDFYDLRFSDTPASGGVPAFPGGDNSDRAYQVQLLGTGLLSASDFNQLVVRYDRTPEYNLLGYELIARYPLWGAWRFGPRVLVQRKATAAGFTQYDYTPYGHLDYQRSHWLLEFEAGAEYGHNPQALELGNTTRLFASAGYRIRF